MSKETQTSELKTQLLERIAREMNGFDRFEMSTAEQNIAALLVDHDYAKYDSDELVAL
jgi:hypothetical protein